MLIKGGRNRILSNKFFPMHREFSGIRLHIINGRISAKINRMKI